MKTKNFAVLWAAVLLFAAAGAGLTWADQARSRSSGGAGFVALSGYSDTQAQTATGWTDTGTVITSDSSNTVRIGSTATYGFSSNAGNTAAADTTLSRCGAGVCSNFGFSGAAGQTNFVSAATSGNYAMTMVTGSRLGVVNAGADYLTADGTTLNLVGSAFASDSTISATNGYIQTISDQNADCDGAATANTPSGIVCINNAEDDVVVTNSLVTTSSLIFVQALTSDATCVNVRVIPGSGSFTIDCNPDGTVSTGESKWNFVIFR